MTTTDILSQSLMSLGLFVFELRSAPYEKLSRTSGWRWGKKDRVGTGPAYEFIGAGEDSITLTGALVPPVTGGPETLATLRRMAADGKAWGLVNGAGEDLGAWIIETVTEDQSHIAGDGTPRRIDFTVTLKYAPDLERLGRLAASAP